MTALFDNCTLDPLAREVVIMTVATRNGCAICVAMHTARLAALDAPPEVIAALRNARRCPTRAWRRPGYHPAAGLHGGRGGRRCAARFLASGYTVQNALEVALGSARTRCPRWPTGSRRAAG